MFTQTQRACIFALAITTTLHLSSGIGFTATHTHFTPSTTLPDVVEAQISLTPTQIPAALSSTSTTLASSNAPATTLEATENRAYQNDDDKIEAHATDVIATTTLPKILKQTIRPDDTAILTATALTTKIQGKATTSSDGNDVKIEITSTARNMHAKEELQLLPLPTTSTPTDEHTNKKELSTMVNIMGKATAATSETLQDSSTATETSTTLNAPITHTPAKHHVKIEGQLKNGLYRIKLAEIVTDEFGNMPSNSHAVKIAEDREHHHDFEAAASKVNIADLYPMKKEDFEPIIRDSNTNLLKERTVFKKFEDEAEYHQNLLPNEVEIEEQQTQQHHEPIFTSDTPRPKPQQLTTLEMTLMSKDERNDGDSVSDFTGKLLAEQDGIITEIEQKFRLSEYVPVTTTTSMAITTSDTVVKSEGIESVTALKTAPTEASSPTANDKNQQPIKGKNHASGIQEFIERRVKKSFAFPMHRTASDAMSAPYVDFANTKFTGNAGNGSPAAKAKTFTGDDLTNGGNAPHDGGVFVAGATHPEFSTTKFYNSKELYNEMVMHNKLRQLHSKTATSDAATLSAHDNVSNSSSSSSSSSGFETTLLAGAASRFAALKNFRNFIVSGEPFSSSTSTTSSTESAIKNVTLTATSSTPNAITSASATLASAFSDTLATTTLKPKKFQKELKRAKLFLKAIMPARNTTNNPTKKNPAIVTPSSTLSSLIGQTSAYIPLTTQSATSLLQHTNLALSSLKQITATSTTTPSSISEKVHPSPASLTTFATLSSTVPELRATNPTKSASKPIARPRILSRLQEKINSLECEIQNVPQESHLWRGNETHELLLPIITSSPCDGDKQQKHQNYCATTSSASNALSWDGEAEIQSGDILIVEINDASLLSDKSSITNAHNTQVYQVTRSGHEHCDVTEGILLDITPLVVDGRKLVTLYDKDLTEGVNLLIVVSELWGTQCVRLKVTTKTDNCGENADCSGKGVCYSNLIMEEYECQCCSGFAGPHCEEIDACTPSPCTNNGICVDLSQGHEGNSYQCLCPYGYTGKNCQYESDPCNPAECMNGGTCVGNSTHFRCDCTSGFAGPLCQHSLNECESSPCIHGICVDQEDGFRCFCQPGFAGELCNFEYNECESNPCQNSGECIDHIGSYECRCSKGYTGNRCQIKVDFCANKPCPEGHRCIDHGNDFSCECPGGRNGPDCNQMARTQCNVNPCTHGGTCWSSGDSFYCACRPGFTGTMCEDEFVVETVVSSSEFIVDDTSARNFNDKTFGSSVVLKSPIELHNAYFAAGVLAAAFFIVAVVVTICHCKVNQTYRKFSTRTTSFIPIIGFGRRTKPQNKLNKHWLSGKGIGSGSSMRTNTAAASSTRGHLTSSHGTALQHNNAGQMHERPFQRHLAMNLENDMYYTVDFSENSQHSPLIQ